MRTYVKLESNHYCGSYILEIDGPLKTTDPERPYVGISHILTEYFIPAKDDDDFCDFRIKKWEDPYEMFPYESRWTTLSVISEAEFVVELSDRILEKSYEKWCKGELYELWKKDDLCEK